MPDWKKNNFAWETQGIAKNTKETLLHLSRFVQTWGCGAAEITSTSLADVLCLDPQKSRAAVPTPSCRAMELLGGAGSREIQTEAARMQMWGCDLGHWGKQELWGGEAEEKAVLAGRGAVSAGQPRDQGRAWKTSAPFGFYSWPIPGIDFIPLGAL